MGLQGMNKLPPARSVCGEGHPVILDAVEEKVVQDVLPPRGEGAALMTTFSKNRKESLAGEALAVHAGKVTKPTEATGAE
jgi:hypothetical protein